MSSRPRRHLRRDDEGVASTVGTVMALLVALAFLSLIVNQYVPVWQREAEAAHMNTALGQFGSLKGAIDAQVVSAQVSAASGTRYIPSETFTSIQLGVEGVPIFASPTNGRLTGTGDAASWTLQFRYAIGGATYDVNHSSSGSVVLDVASRYHIPFQVAYESGAIIMSQAAGETIRVEPQFTVLNSSQGVEVGLSLVQLVGSGSVSGHASEGVRTKLIALDMQEFDSFRSSLWINHTTAHGHAWFRYLNQTLPFAFGVLETDFEEAPGTCTDAPYDYCEGPTGQTVQTPYYVLQRAQGQNQTLHTIQLEIRHNPNGGVPIAKLSFHQAYVGLALGRSGSTLGV